VLARVRWVRQDEFAAGGASGATEPVPVVLVLVLVLALQVAQQR